MIEFNCGGVFEATLGFDLELSGIARLDIFLGFTTEIRVGPKYEFNTSGAIVMEPTSVTSRATEWNNSIMRARVSALESKSTNISLSGENLIVEQGALAVSMRGFSVMMG